VIGYLAMLDVPRELVRHLARLLAAQRRLLGTRRRTRALTCYYQALMVLVWFRKAEDTAVLGAGFGVSGRPRTATSLRASRSWPPSDPTCMTPCAGPPPMAGRS